MFSALDSLAVAGTLVGVGKILEIISKTQLKGLGQYEWKQQKPWFDEECSKFVDQRKQAKLQ